ncbi:MAG: glycosyltransferase family 2 protein [Bacteroidales bacterium]|nr:glycosyltransferase family 2 protein [Bacteroidales bacterium]
MLSVICPIYNEEKYIAKCIDSVLQQDYPKDDLEIFFVDGMSGDKTAQIVYEYSQKYPFIKLLKNPYRTVPYAMNIGINASKGDTIIRLDGHCEYPENYFSCLVDNLKKYDADNVGGVFITLPCNETNISYAIAECLKNPFGMGNSLHRIGAKENVKTDSVPFGCFKREVFDKVGLYDEELIRNQDDELNARIIKNGGSIYLIPTLGIKYFARDKVSKVRKMFYQYGLFKPLVNKKLGQAATIRQFVPPLFVAALIFGALLSVFSKIFLWLYLGFLILYFAIGIMMGVKSAKVTKRPSMVCLMPWIFFNVHLSYGIGYWIGLFKVLFNRPFTAQSNR